MLDRNPPHGGTFVDPILTYDPERLEAWFAECDEPQYRAAQVRRWLFERRADSFEAMTDLPRNLRAALAEQFRLWTTEIVRRQRSDDGTEKLLLRLADGHTIECVLIREHERRTICISTQVGCAMGCVFCASGLDGVVRNLTTGEIIEQMLRLAQLLPHDERLSHIVVMGMGEPLANLKNLLPALAQAIDPAGLAISARRVTISSVGLPEGIARLAAARVPYHLAVSLHAPDDELRNRLVPVNKQIGIGKILAAADDYFAVTHRRVTFEYVLLGGVNDRPEHARALVDRLRGRPALLNVIPYNPVAGLPYRTPTPSAQSRFRGVLEQGGVRVQFRLRKGDRIDAACGQLRRWHEAAQPPSAMPLAVGNRSEA
ncbi:MAG: 23S rRNA (adenine(2503)-C(2))-methyltransferase RlmN [Pirellulales bacterium]|nr:23S rRNA (adenine(2503)-C(2))-methyltransferase RlmN [Pirellulales bacterium]